MLVLVDFVDDTVTVDDITVVDDFVVDDDAVEMLEEDEDGLVVLFDTL